jgi:Domain of unknown function (DUF4781)
MATSAPQGSGTTPFTPFLFDPAAAAAAEARRQALEAARRAAAAAQEAARIAAQAAAAARAKAEASRVAAQKAEAAAAARNAKKAEKDNAVTLRAQATRDEADAQKKEAASKLADADKVLKNAKVDDLVTGRAPADPSAATVKAQAEYDAAAKTDAIVNETPSGGSTPLQVAQADTLAKQKAAQAAAKVVADAKAQGSAPTQAQTTAAQQTQTDWAAAIDHQLRVAAVDATANGRDPNAAIDAQVKLIGKDVQDGGYFDPDSVQAFIQPGVEHIKAESTSQRELMLEYESVQADGTKQIAAAQADVKTTAAAATKADAAARPVYGPFAPGKEPPANINAPFPALLATPGAATSTPQTRAAQAHADANAAQTRLATLEAAFGHTDAADPSQNTVGTVQADFNARGADIGASDAHSRYLQVLNDPQSTPAQTSTAYDAWQTAVDQQTLMRQMKIAIDADAALLQAQQTQAAAQTALDGAKTQQPSLIFTTGPSGRSAAAIAPDGHDPTLALDYHNPEDAKRVSLVDGRYVYTSSANGTTTQQPLAPAAAALWDANTKLDAAKKAATAANDDLKQTWADQHGGPDGKGLDVAGWLKNGDQYNTELANANTDVATAQQNLRMAQSGHLPDSALPQARISLGDALQRQKIAQARVDAVHAMQLLRSGQMVEADGTQCVDIATLTGNARAAVKKIDDLQGAQLMTVDDETKLRTETLPGEITTLQALDKKLQAAKTAADAAPGNTTAATAYTDLANQYDWLQRKITVQQNSIKLADAQRAALAAPTEYANTQPPLAGVDLHARTHSDANDAALTWGITPGQDGKPVLTGLPDNIKPEEVTVQKKDDGNWYVTFGKSSGAYAMHMTGSHGGAYVSYADGSKAGDAAIEKDHAYRLNADAARYWEATNTDPGVGNSRLLAAKTDLDKAIDATKYDPVTDATGKPVTGAQPQPAASTPDFNVDQTAAKTTADAKVVATATTLTTAQNALNAGAGDAATLKASVADATASHDLALAEQNAVGAVLAWQQANRVRQAFDADQRAGRPATACFAKPPQETADDLLTTATAQVAQWRSMWQKVEVGRAQAEVDHAQTAYDQWLRERPYLSNSAGDSAPAQALQAAKVRLDAATRDQAGAAVGTAEAAQKAFVANNLAPGGENDPHAMYELFMKDPRVMAQAIINSDYAQKGGMPTTMANRTQLRNTVALELGYTPTVALDPTTPDANATLTQTQDLFGNLDKDRRAMLDKTVDQIVSVGGEHAKLTVLPVVYAVDGDKSKGGGIVKTALFKVEGKDGGSAKFVDESGARYDSVNDYRANNQLPVEGVNLAMPEDGNFTLDENGNVKLFAGDARTETGWQTFRRETHLDAVVGGLAIAGGVLLEFGSAGTLTPVAGALILGGASLYGVATSAQALTNRADHGLSINPFTDREAGLDWLNLGASALALPSLGSAGRGAAMMLRAEQAATGAADLARAASTTGRFVSFTGKAAMVTGSAAMADGGAYMAQNWDKMSSAERWEQGGMFLLNLASFGAHPAAQAFKQRAALLGAEGTAPAVAQGGSRGLWPPEARTPGLGTHATTAELLDSGALPGVEGITLTDRIHFESFDSVLADMYRLSTLDGRRIEFALTFEKVDGQWVHRLYSGSVDHVPLPEGAHPIAHTHPTPHSNHRFASPGDMQLLNRLHDARLADNPSAAARPHFVVFGEKVGLQGDVTVVFPGPYKGDYFYGDTTTLHAPAAAAPAPAPVATGRDEAGVPLPPTSVFLNLNSWSDVALHADAVAQRYEPASRASAPRPSRDETAALDQLVAKPRAKSRTRFAVSGTGPHEVIFEGRGTATKGKGVRTFDSFNEASRHAQNQGGAWVHRVEPDPAARQPNVLRRGRADAHEVVGSVHVYGDGSRMPIAVPNPAAAGHAPLPPSTVNIALGSWNDVALHADALVAQHHAKGSAQAPRSAEEAALFERVTRGRVRGTRMRFEVSTTSPHDAHAGANRAGGETFKTFEKAQQAAQARGGAWVHRLEAEAMLLPSPRRASLAERYEVVGSVHVDDGGSVFPLAIPNTQAAAWIGAEHPVLARVVASATGGTLLMGTSAAAAAQIVPEHVLGTTLTLTVFGTALRAGVKAWRYSQAARWETRFQSMQERLPSKAHFETTLNELQRSAVGRGTPAQQRDFADAVQEVRNHEVQPWQGRRAYERQVLGTLDTLETRAKALGLDAGDRIAEMKQHARDKAYFDTALQVHTNFGRQLDKPFSVRNFLSGIPQAKRGELRGSLESLHGAVDRLTDANPHNDAKALADVKTSLDALHVAPNLRSPNSPVRWAIDGAQVATYAVSLGYAGHDLAMQGSLPWYTGAFALANAMDGVRIVGVRLGMHVPGFKSPEGQLSVPDHPLFKVGLPFGDDALTFAGGTLMTAKSGWVAHTQGWTVARDVDFAVKAAYAYASFGPPKDTVQRGYVDAALNDPAARSAFLKAKWVAGGAALLLVTNSVGQALLSDDGSTPAPGSPGTPVTPTPTTTTSPTPTAPGPTSGPTPPSTPAVPVTPAQVIVQAGDPRRSTLWGIAQAHEDTLLTSAEIDAAQRQGGGDAVVLDALQQLFQINPQRGFRPELMDGVPTALHGDPDTIQPGWEIVVEKAATG